MKSIFKIHPLTYFFILLFILLGYFKFYLYFMLVIIIHEIGHLTFALIFRWKIKNITILPLGALIKFEDNLNKPIKEEFIIAIMGIVFQSVLLLFVHNEMLVMCYKIVLIFNLIPIYPLDGAKIINLLLNKIINFKKSYLFSLILSYIIVILLISFSIIKSSLFIFLIVIPLLFSTINLIVSRNEIYMKFLLERYLYKLKFKKYKYVISSDRMMRDYKHCFIIEDKIISEDENLKNIFERKIYR